MPATHTVNIAWMQDDPYIRDWYHGSHAQGVMSNLEQANAALAQADLLRVIATERGDDLDRAQAEAICERVATAASACAIASRMGEESTALAFAQKAAEETLVLASFDYVNVS